MKVGHIVFHIMVRSICCTANTGCFGEDMSINSIEFTSGFNIGIRCDGASSCSSGSIYSSSGGDMYLSGYLSGGSSSIEFVSNNQSGDVICTGKSSCWSITEIKNVLNVYCVGYFSCYSLSSMNNIYGNIFVLGYSGIDSTTINNVNGNIYCVGHRICEDITIKNVDGYIYTSGYYSLRSSTITNVSQVFCNGEDSCRSSIFTNVASLSFSGEDSMLNAVIYSSSSNTTVTIHTNDVGESNIYCNNSDTCLLNCVTSDSCEEINLSCEDNSTCIIDCCESSGITCPSINGNWEYPSGSCQDPTSQSPTPNPTSMPTEFETSPPTTKFPTSNPTSNPTSMPTELEATELMTSFETTVVAPNTSGSRKMRINIINSFFMIGFAVAIFMEKVF